MADLLTVARIGGIAGFGLARGHLHSDGSVAMADLTVPDRARVEALFAHPPPSGPGPDGFRYRLTRNSAPGAQTVEVDEADVPPTVRACVRDRLD